MRIFRACFTALFSTALLLATVAPAAHASNIRRSSTSAVHHRRTAHHYIHHRRYRHTARVRGQKAIQPERVTQIQQALIREHYLDGEPSGKWDDATKAAMLKFQADNGWQTKITPDSRALEKLGLGEDYSGAINAKSLPVASQPAGAPIPTDQEAGFAAASGVSQ